jgi:hypothetical protein
MKPTARLILGEFIVSGTADFDFSKWTDLQMLVLFGGRERTESEHRHLLSGQAFEIESVVVTNSPVSLVIARPV